MRINPSVILVVVMVFFFQPVFPLAYINDGLSAALKTDEKPFTDVSPEDILVKRPEPVRGSFLVAAPALKGSFFSRSVILLLNHGDQGSSGLVVNRPSHINLSTVFPDETEMQNNTDKIYTGGPVEINRFLILIKSEDKPPGSHRLLGNIHMSASIKTLKFIYRQKGSSDTVRVFFGYAGWQPDQLMREIERGSWYVMSGDAELVFDKDSEGLWDRLIQMRGRSSRIKKDASEP